jgi:hypothetical protein
MADGLPTQYNIAVKVINPEDTWKIQTSLQRYSVFVDRSHNLDRTTFVREELPYIGEVIVIKTLKREAAEVAREVLTSIEGLLVLPTTECPWERDKHPEMGYSHKSSATLRFTETGVEVTSVRL